MFQEVVLQNSEKDLHHYILWDDSGSITDWRMNILTLGVASSLFVAVQVLQQLARKNKSTHPRASAVDPFDWMTFKMPSSCVKNFASSLNVSKEMVKQYLRIIQSVSEELHEKEDLIIPSESSFHIKTIGIRWNATDDIFHVGIPDLDRDTVPT